MDKRLGKRNAGGFESYPEQYAGGGIFVRNSTVPPVWVNVGNNFFYVLPVGKVRLADGVHEELVAIAAAGGELPAAPEPVEELPFAVESALEVPSRRRKNEGAD